MITKAEIKKIISYKQRKIRDKDDVFIVEGEKMVEELINSGLNIDRIFAKKEWLYINKKNIAKCSTEISEISEDDLRKISSLITPNKVLAIVRKKRKKEIQVEGKLILVLDDIKDPGNLGTIIRIADWFGIEDIVCSNNSVELYNPKTIQATMGSIFRINITYTNIAEFLSLLPKNYPIYSTVLEEGKNIYNEELSSQGAIIIGSESHGVSKELLSLSTKLISIPNFSLNKGTESLNVSIATGIVVSEFIKKRSEI